ncbi:hypothetical protein L6164_012594 [Bauhinia variegata]|uniref:Uncharacterized protein n=1 Tax=Bauhinia variegata TaxID=167791 RepID=A0ACB9PFQ3_BAUVA|nr:hypothetical protein L6164_012594 [Bauhinia variegata]
MTIPDDEEPGSLMYFGSRAVVYGYQTPIQQSDEGLYFVKIDGITLGDEKFPYYNKQILIDSGTSHTLLHPDILDPLLYKLRRLVQPIHSPGVFELCFNATAKDVRNLPTMTFHFDGADVELIKETTYMEFEDNLWCFVFVRSTNDLSLFGNMQMRDFWIGYDLENKIVSFQPAICAHF